MMNSVFGFTAKNFSRGQSLVEFILVMPILVFIMMGGYFMGLNFYQAQMTSSAVQQVALNKLDMARRPEEITPAVLQGYINASPTRASAMTATFVDSVNTTNAGDYVTVVQGGKRTQGWPGVIPGLNVSVPQVVNANLLLSATAAGATTRSAAAWTGPPPLP